MIDHNTDTGRFEITCDRCPEDEEIEEASWADMITDIKTLGWSIHREGDGYTHLCPSCTEDEENEHES
jgi:hypothetical protein